MLRHTKGLCNMCRGPVRPPRSTFCGDYCVYVFMRLQHIKTAMRNRDYVWCQECGEANHYLELDHILPVRHGGGCSGAWNIVKLCAGCHLSRNKTKLPAPMGIPIPPKFLDDVWYTTYQRAAKTTEERHLYYQMGPMITRAERMKAALKDYRKHPDLDHFAQRIFWELECLQEQLLILHRCIEFKPLETAWLWCHEALSYLHVQHGYQLQIPLHLPLI